MIYFRQKSIKTFYSAACLLFLVACSNKPGADLVNQSMEKLLKSEAVEGVFEIKNVKRVNGFKLNDFYNVEISFERHCLVGIDEAALKINDLDIRDEDDPKTLVEGMLTEFIGMIAETGVLQYDLKGKYGDFNQGDVLQETAKIRYIKTENGWMEYEAESE